MEVCCKQHAALSPNRQACEDLSLHSGFLRFLNNAMGLSHKTEVSLVFPPQLFPILYSALRLFAEIESKEDPRLWRALGGLHQPNFWRRRLWVSNFFLSFCF